MRRKKKVFKVVAAVLAFTLLSGMFPAQCLMAAPDETTENTEEGVEGRTRREVVKISTVEDFTAFAEQCYLDSWSVGKWVILERDIDLSDVDFDMIPIFAGTFDGNGHTISGFHSVGDGYVGGLFRYITQSGTVRNLNLKGDVEGTEEKECIGSVCGVNYGTIRNCKFIGNISGRDTVGGIAGTNEVTGFIVNCSINGHVSGYYMTGGIVGVNRGSVSWCSNYSGINDDSEWVEEDDEMGSGLLLGINSSDSDVEFYSGVDTGGIAGYSDGTISNCFNYGKVGYEHTGYNIGGIVGRQAGVVSFCVNSGEVYGRKDVGGIVGQMEPYIEVDEAESLRNAVNKLHDLIGKTLKDLQAGKNAVKADLDHLNAYGDGALSSGHDLANQLTDFADTNVGQIHEMNVRMDYVVSQLPAVVEDLSAAGEAFKRFSDRMDQAMKDAGAGDLPDLPDSPDVPDLPNIPDLPNLPDIPDFPDVDGGEIGQAGQAGQDSMFVDVDSLQEGTGLLSQSADRIRGIITDGNSSAKEWEDLNDIQQQALMNEVVALIDDSQSTEEAAARALNQLSSLALDASSDEVRKDLDAAMDQLQSMADSLQSATNRTKDIVNYLNNQPKLQFAVLGDAFDKSRENLYGQLQGIADSLKSLSQNASDYSDLANADLNAVNDQLNVVFNLLADHLSGNSGLSVEEMYEEVSDDEIDSITTGRAASCTNKGVVKGDINIGGIAGSMAIDEEDPEDNAAGSIDYEIGRRFIMKCIIQDCANEGYITAKKDGAGGIVGYMAHGIVIDSESYGSVESAEGDYVGGICGESLTVIRRCFSLCDVSGGKNIGGIAGYANTLKDCYAIVNVEATMGRKGAIAGQIAEQSDTGEGIEANVCRNYYVDDILYGIDNISYIGIAEPISYQELLTVEGVPGEFRHLKVTYRVEDMYLGTEEVAFGESLAGLHYPDIPVKEGCYGVWPDYSGEVMNGNLVIRGEYHDDVRVVVSSQRDTENTNTEEAYQKPYALVEWAFTEDTVLNVREISAAPPDQATGKAYVMYEVSLENGGIEEGDVFAVRLLNPYKNAQVWGLSDNAWTLLESKERGQYLQVDMSGTQKVFCIVKIGYDTVIIVAGAAGAAAILVLLTVVMTFIKKHKAK